MKMIENLDKLEQYLKIHLTYGSFEDAKWIVESYNGNDWTPYSRPRLDMYSRYRLSYENSKFDMYILTWLPNQKADFHDHAKNGCIMKILKGELKETILHTDTKHTSEKILSIQDCGYINDRLGYHSIENTGDKIAVSLHIYSPPNHVTTYL